MTMTIKDIARLSGYSLGTVSRVLNGHPDVSEAAREKVMAVVREQGFEPNANARHLKMRAQSAIAVLVKGTRNLLFADILERIQSLLQDSGEDVYVAYLDEDADEVQYAIQLEKLRRPKGFLFLGGDLEYFRRGFGAVTVPSVLLTNDAQSLGFENLSSFTTDDGAAAGEVVDYLYRCGHRRIGVVGGNWASEQISVKRLQGFQRAMERHGLDFDPARHHAPCRYSMTEGYSAAKKLLEQEPGLTAVFALGDVIAMGAMRAFCDLGRRVPDDISLIGYDGIEVASFCIPRLTTIRQDTAQLAEQGVRTLLRAIHRRAEPVHRTIGFALLERESVRPAP